MKAKYIVVKNGLNYTEIPYVFPCSVVHSDFANRIVGESLYSYVVSGGFVFVDGESLIPYGGSMSLRLTSRPEDKELFKKEFGD